MEMLDCIPVALILGQVIIVVLWFKNTRKIKKLIDLINIRTAMHSDTGLLPIQESENNGTRSVKKSEKALSNAQERLMEHIDVRIMLSMGGMVERFSPKNDFVIIRTPSGALMRIGHGQQTAVIG